MLFRSEGSAEDWIEIYNAGSVSANLAGFGLSDESDQPFKWVFPATNLPPKSFLIVFASGKDRRTPGSALHANFKLSLVGGPLLFTTAELVPQTLTQFKPKYPEQRNDYSYGLSADGQWRHFKTPTPGAANGSSAIEGVTDAPQIGRAHV